MQNKTETPPAHTPAIYQGQSQSPPRAILTSGGWVVVEGMTAGEALAVLGAGGRRIVTTGEG
jgi:hypothetical protein